MWSLVWKLQMIMGLKFRIVRNKAGYIFLKDMKYRTNYSLYYVGMSEDQILEIARIIDEVFSKNERDNRQRLRDVPTRNLNGTTELSRQFVARVLNLDRSDLHKFFLLTSGAYVSSPGSEDLLMTLADAKPESCGDLDSIFETNRIFESLQETYILPGVTESNSHNYATAMLNAAMMRHPVEMIARLLVFVANENPKLTLAEHLRLKDNEAFATIKPIRTFNEFSFIEEFLARKSGYFNLGHRLTAPELFTLSFLMSDGYTRIPVDFLFNRVTSMNKISHYIDQARFLSPYLSPSEMLRFNQYTIGKINESMTDGGSSRSKNAPIIYAAIAELLVQKGEQRTLDVVHELKHLGRSKSVTIEATEATVLLILEALKPENDEMPFSWAAQLSEHAWVLNDSPSRAEWLALKV